MWVIKNILHKHVNIQKLYSEFKNCYINSILLKMTQKVNLQLCLVIIYPMNYV